MTKLKQLILILSMVIFCQASNAGKVISTSILYTKINNPDYKYIDDSEQLRFSNLNIGYTAEIKGVFIGLHSNRLFYRDVVRKVKMNGRTYNNKTKVRSDILQIGYRVQRFIPYLFITNTEVDTRLITDHKTYRRINNINSYGLGVNYIINQSVSLGFNYIAPTEEIDLEGGIGFTINYAI